MLGGCPAQVQDLAFGIIGLHEVFTYPSLKPVWVPLDGISSLQHVAAPQLGFISKFAECAPNSTIQVTNTDVKQGWSQ